MKQYRIIYIRPYLPEPEHSEPQRSVVNAESEDEVNKIYEDCKITFIEEIVPAEAAYQQEHEEWLDEQATRESVRPFRPF